MLTSLVIGVVVFHCGLQPSNCDDATHLKNEILQMNEQSKLLVTYGEELKQQVVAAKAQCDQLLAPLIEKRDKLLETYKLVVDKLEEVNLKLTEKLREEELLVRALNREFHITNKYQLQITLLKQELEMYMMAESEGLIENCPRLKPIFERYGTSLSMRSMGGRAKRLKSETDYLITLANELNTEKIKLKSIQVKNEELKNELEKINSLCASKKLGLEELIQTSQEQLKEGLQNLDMIEAELKDAIETVEVRTRELEERKELNRKLKAESLELKAKVDSYGLVKECFSQILAYDVRYK